MSSRSSEPLVVGRVIGEVLDPFTPSMKMLITYNNKLIFNGHELYPSAIGNEPLVKVQGEDLRSLFTLVCTFSFDLGFYSEFFGLRKKKINGINLTLILLLHVI